MNPNDVLLKVQEDMVELMTEVNDDPASVVPMLEPLIEFFTKNGYFEQLEDGEANSVKWLLGVLVETGDALAESKEKADLVLDKLNLIAQGKQAEEELATLVQS